MKTHDVQSISIAKPRADVFAYIANPANLPDWTNAFKSADAERAELVTPNGAVPIRLETRASAEQGTIDWIMTFPDGSVGAAYSRVTEDAGNSSIYSFVLMAPPVPLEALEGALEAQKKTLATELVSLRKRLEA
ncbi:SRPBCC family protein [Tritonibacter horizontis]|uniref:Polyketide cyclase / dehydrase and lipid transport n=1 Tax=Tritonibacter horizontis TaxID=1768241 RepID=A0A132C1P0_9RHOB|nr:SRPBCC family protein [Tritonibacter horizontis]KUP94047.1 polyketide cyclase / dehydrase and lipid transport [Tritonibacter horizontis]